MFRVVALIASALCCTAFAACSFDNAALGDRACSADSECPDGTCVDGYCTIGVAGDVAGDGGDIASPDTGMDVDDGGPLDDAGGDGIDDTDAGCFDGLTCDGALVVECSGDSSVVVADCSVPASCDDLGGGCACIDGACVSLVCAMGERRCDGNVIESCDDGGTAWVAGTTCGEGTVCAGGACVPTECEAGTTFCQGTVVVTCDEGGEISGQLDCAAADEVCRETDGGADCIALTCDEGVTVCAFEVGIDQNGVAACTDPAVGWVVEPCGDAEVCEAGACVPQACIASETRCIDPQRSGACNATGSAETVTECDETAYCSPASGTCVADICVAEELRCADQTHVEICAESGGSWVADSTCDGGQRCVDGECTDLLCVPGSTFCDAAGDSAVCSSDGLSVVSTESCDFSCVAGSCVSSSCGDGIVDAAAGEQCDDRNALACDGCVGCAIESGLSVATDLRRSDGPVWATLRSDATIEAWVNVTGTDGILFGVGRTGGEDAVFVQVVGGLLVGRIRNGNGDFDEETVVVGRTRITGRGWVHVAFVRRESRRGYLFVNGLLDGYNWRDYSASSIDENSGWIWVGHDGVGTPVAADIDEYRVSSVARYTTPFGPRRTLGAGDGTVAYFTFDEGTGNIANSDVGGTRMTFTNARWTPDACFGAAANSVACGDGQVARWEECDDGDTEGGDGCAADCARERVCRDGIARAEREGGLGGCYLPVLVSGDWDTARGACTSWGGDLVTVNNAAEQAWLSANIAGTWWGGGNDQGTWDERNWRWASGQSWGYTAWDSGEPNDGGFGGNEDCLEVRASGKWNDLACDDSRFGLCERTW